MGVWRERPSAELPTELPGLDAPPRDGGGVTVERGDGDENDEIESPRVVLRLIAEAAESRRPLEEERSDEPRIRWLYLCSSASTCIRQDAGKRRHYTCS